MYPANYQVNHDHKKNFDLHQKEKDKKKRSKVQNFFKVKKLQLLPVPNSTASSLPESAFLNLIFLVTIVLHNNILY